ncbi:MAG TPA: long-chain fatty acid--CoA ligase [Myxococcales bacterium]|nr:long-chain fatty acid--CoA ligase [Myxococcales bacterium]
MLANLVSNLSELFQLRISESESAECYRVKKNDLWLPVSWSVFAGEVRAVSAGLIESGFEHGQTVAILGKTSPSWCEIDMGGIFIGGCTVGIYDTLLVDQVEFLLQDSGASFLFVEGRASYERVLPLLDTVDSLKQIVVWDYEAEAREGVMALADLKALGRKLLERKSLIVESRASKVSADDVALVVYTSGTTGRPKGVPLSHKNVLSQLKSNDMLIDDISGEDITISFLPMAHVAEHVPGFFGRLNTGMRTAFATNYDTLLDELLEVRPTYFGAVPRIFEKMYGRILERVAHSSPRRQAIFGWVRDLARRRARAAMGGPALSFKDRMMLPLADRLVYRKIRDVFGGRVKAFVTGAAPIDLEILEFFYGVGMKIIEVYGLSEATAISFANTLERQQLGTVGWAIPGLEYKLADDGEILLRGPTVFSGYLNLAQENDKLFDDEGYLYTGDIGELTEGGCLRITDRKKNLIKTAGGKYVIPARVESVAKSEPLISQVYVHGDNRPYVVALITLDDRETGRVAEELKTTAEALPTHPVVVARVAKAVEVANSKLARFERIKHHVILPKDFSLEAGTLTPTLKIKRRIVADHYSSEIDRLYSEASASYQATSAAPQ